MSVNEVYKISRLKCFCYKCGAMGYKDIDVIEKSFSDGEKYTVPKNKNHREKCEICDKLSFVIFNQYNMGLAVEFLLVNMHHLKKANDSEAIQFLANILDVG